MISIAMTTYNGEKYLQEQINSILNQTYKEYELIICDDCSSDSTWEIIINNKKNDTRIYGYRNERNIGFINNFEKAINLCSGEYIALSDQDDIWTSDHLEVLVNNIDNASLICSNALLVDNNGLSHNKTMHDILNLSNLNLNEKTIAFFIFYNNFIQGSSSLFKKNLLIHACPFPASTRYHDHWLALNAVMENRIIYLNRVTLLYRQHKKTITKDKEKTYISLLKKINIKAKRTYPLLLALQERYQESETWKKDMLAEAVNFYRSREISFFPVYAFIFLIKHYKQIYCQNDYKFIICRLCKMLLKIF